MENTAGISARRLAVAAMELVEREGEEALTMKRLAAELDRKASSLYNHISSRENLVEHMRSLIVERIDTSSFATKAWDEAIVDWGTSYLAAFAAHPKCIRLLATTPITDASTLQMYNVVVSALANAGWPAGQSVAVMRTVEAHVLGSALDIVAPSFLLSDSVIPQNLTALRDSLAPAHHHASSAQAAFDLGLQALVAGLRSTLDP